MDEPSEASSPTIGRRSFLFRAAGTVWALPWLLPVWSASATPVTNENTREGDPYECYVRTSIDFQRVRQDKTWIEKSFPGWLYMPWTYQWTIGYTGDSGRWCESHGVNGAFLDGNGQTPDSPPGKLAWINQFGLRFYLDHTAAKHYLHLWDGDQVAPHVSELRGTGMRPVPLNAALLQKLCGIIRNNISQVQSSAYRAAYALDDETSWGSFIQPTMWQITDDAGAYPAWLAEVYGADAAPTRTGWMSYEDIWRRLASWPVQQFDASPLMDQWSFNDSLWCNFLGHLVQYANTVDPHTPCGIVGAQAPNAFGGYDYAKLMRKIQYIEAYNLGSSQAIVRSFNPGLALPAVTSTFHQSAADDIWQVWYYLANGNRGHIGWVQDWFDGTEPKPWLDQDAPTFLEASQKIGPLMRGATWRHDGVALYYSQPSIQLGWILDAAAHGETWVNRQSDVRLGASHHVRHAWENMLRDSGLQTNFLSYVDVVQNGIPSDYRVLILPACLALSDAEARAIEAFCRRGGMVIADYLPAVWDQHGRGRAKGGALDALFGVRHDPHMTSVDVFGGDSLWCEINQDLNYDWKTYQEFMTNGNTCILEPNGFHKAVRAMPTANVRRVGNGTAVLMNLSPQWYNAYRVAGADPARKRDVFMHHLTGFGLRRWVSIESAGDTAFGSEVTYFRLLDGRTVLFLCANPEIEGTETGGGNASALQTGPLDVTLVFTHPIRQVRDERTEKTLPDGTRFPLTWQQNEALVLSFMS